MNSGKRVLGSPMSRNRIFEPETEIFEAAGKREGPDGTQGEPWEDTCGSMLDTKPRPGSQGRYRPPRPDH